MFVVAQRRARERKSERQRATERRTPLRCCQVQATPPFLHTFQSSRVFYGRVEQQQPARVVPRAAFNVPPVRHVHQLLLQSRPQLAVDYGLRRGCGCGGRSDVYAAVSISAGVQQQERQRGMFRLGACRVQAATAARSGIGTGRALCVHDPAAVSSVCYNGRMQHPVT